MQDLKVEVKTVIKAPVERVFNAWLDPAQMKQWYAPHGMTTPEASSDAAVGGNYTVTMKGSSQTVKMAGEYLEIDEPNKLVFTWNDENSIVTVQFKQIDEKTTEVQLVHTGFVDEKSRAEHDHGWQGVLSKLNKYLTS